MPNSNFVVHNGLTVGTTTITATTGEITKNNVSVFSSLSTLAGNVTTLAGNITSLTTLTANSVLRTSTTGSAILPSGNTAQRDSAPVAGYIRWNQTTVAFEGYSGITWIPVSGEVPDNKIINGNFDLWQVGASLVSGTGLRYLADQWQNNSLGTTYTAARVAHVVGQTAVPNEPQFFHRTVVTSVAGVGNFCQFRQLIENVRNYAGKTVTLSFYAKADVAKNIAVEFVQNFGLGGTPSVNVDSIGVTTLALTAAFQKFSVTVAIPSISGKVLGTTENTSICQFNFWFEAGANFNTRTNSLGQQSGTFDISQVWIEEGSQSTKFPLRLLQQELALCQRYYFTGIFIIRTTAAYTDITTPVTMRVNPTLSGGGAGFAVAFAGTTVNSVSQTTLAGQTIVFDARF